MVHKSKDLVGGGSVKGKNGKVVVNESDVMENLETVLQQSTK